MIKILLFGFIYFLVIGAYVGMPLIGKLVVLVINMFISDPLPLIDEIFMFLSMGKHLERFENVITYIQLHKVARKRLVITIIVAIIVVIVAF